MKFEITIDAATLGDCPIVAISNILQNQAEKLLRWSDATAWSDTLLDANGKAVGSAKLVPDIEPALHPMFQAIFDQFLTPPATAQHQAFKSDEVTNG